MHLHIKATQIDLTDPLRTYLDEKIASLDRYIGTSDGPVEAVVEVGRSTQHHRKADVMFAEVNLHLGGKLLRAKAFSQDVRAAIDEVREELYREILKTKGRRETLYKRGARSIKKFLKLSPLARFRRGKLEE
ncbi:MAG: ribosome-associated translation inhibitor RaiA [bacterium]|nr:ribosome-associated translation inhibitor RaiA [bacterium]